MKYGRLGIFLMKSNIAGKRVSIVTTLYKSAPHLEQFYNRITAAVNQAEVKDYEIIFVDDGSPDESLQSVLKLMELDSKIELVELSRNFGHHKALMTGLEYSNGDFVFLIDSDLEEPPELFVAFWQQLNHSDDYDVIYGVQEQRKGGWLERWSGKVYFKLFNLLSDSIKVTENLSTVRLMKRKYVDALLEYKESEFYFGPVAKYVGFRQMPHKIQKQSSSMSTYSLLSRYNFFINSIFSFSKKPLFFIFYSGMLITTIATIVGCTLLFKKVMWDETLEGWTSLMLSVWFLGGIIISFVGLISIYISKIFEETKNRPFIHVRNHYRSDRD